MVSIHVLKDKGSHTEETLQPYALFQRSEYNETIQGG